MTGTDVRWASQDEIAKEIEALTDEHYKRLMAFAISLSLGLPMIEPGDLLHEAFSRSLDGTRRWNLHYPFDVFVYGAMKSIASDMRTKKSNKEETRLTELVFDSDSSDVDVLDTLSSDDSTPESVALAAEYEAEAKASLHKIEEFFKDDDNVTAILIGRREGFSAARIQEEFELTVLQYNSATTKLRRGIYSIFGKRD